MPTERLGTLTMQIGYDNRPDLFTKFTPDTSTQPSDFDIYLAQNKDQFRFTQPPSSPIQFYFARKLAAISQAHGTALTCLNIPFFGDRKSAVIQERYYWPEAMQAPVNIVGIPPSALFDGLPDQDIAKLFWDPYHFNQNGQAYFTRLLSPSLIDLYDDATKN